ncbi:MAG: hypothetical protein IKS69_02735, partial [Erysipelotrichaceae bacterium]|nr:hypothetical protein [Erysipelotrichaceae bacterium]
VKDRYDALNDSVENKAEIYDTFLKNDYMNILNEVSSQIEDFDTGITKDDADKAEKLYSIAIGLEKIASLFSTDSSQQMMLLAEQIKQLVVAAFNKSNDFKDLKVSIQEKITEISSWESDQWKEIEKRKKIGWDTVSEHYEELLEEVEETLTRRWDITESELEELKDLILARYEEIGNGVDESNQEAADALYVAGWKLKEYTEDLDGDAAEKVFQLGKQTMEYVQQAYGKTIDDPDYDFPSQIRAAGKWTLSLLNEVTTKMKQ